MWRYYMHDNGCTSLPLSLQHKTLIMCGVTLLHVNHSWNLYSVCWWQLLTEYKPFISPCMCVCVWVCESHHYTLSALSRAHSFRWLLAYLWKPLNPLDQLLESFDSPSHLCHPVPVVLPLSPEAQFLYIGLIQNPLSPRHSMHSLQIRGCQQRPWQQLTLLLMAQNSL